MRTSFLAIGIALIVLGGIWITQGIGVLKGSFMTGSPVWGWIGVICTAVGVVLVLIGGRTHSR